MNQLTHIFRPRLAAVLWWISISLEFLSKDVIQVLGWDLAFSPWIFAMTGTLEYLIGLYLWLTLWQILLIHFRFRSISPFIIGVLMVELVTMGFFITDSFPNSGWRSYLYQFLYHGTLIAYSIKILSMPGDLFGRKYHYGISFLSLTLVLLAMDHLFPLLDNHFQFESYLPLILFGVLALAIYLFYMIVLTQIYLRAAKATPPEDRLDQLIDNIGQDPS